MLSDELADKRIIDFTDEELIEAGFKGDGVPESITEHIRTIKARPELLKAMTGFILYCMMEEALKKPAVSQGPPLSPPSNFSEVTVATSDNNLTLVDGNLVSDFEKHNYYVGLCANDDDVPLLYYRTSLEKAPFPLPEPGARFFKVAKKTAHGPFHPVLTRALWSNTVGPEIVSLLDQHGIGYASLKGARFSTYDDRAGQATLGPLVIWIGTHLGTTNPEHAREVSPAILRILTNHGVTGAEVEWYETKVERLRGPPLMNVVNRTNPTHHYRRPFTGALSFPVAAKALDDLDGQGTVGMVFHENKTHEGEPSDRVLAATNAHVLRRPEQVDQDYEYMGGGERREEVRLLGERGYNKAVTETKSAVATMGHELYRLSEEVERLEKELKNATNADEEDAKLALERTKRDLSDMEVNNRLLRRFYKDINTQWRNPDDRLLGYADYAPSISFTVDNTHHTRDLGVFELIPEKISAVYMGNMVDLGGRYLSHQLHKIFCPNPATANFNKFPSNGLLRIRGWVSRDDVLRPTGLDENGFPVFIVGKVGSTTGFTFGRYNDLDAFLCDSNGVKSQEVVIYNYDKSSGNFSDPGDSGAMIWLSNGQRLAVLHSGEVKGLSTHVTYGTPAWWYKIQVEVKYPYADFERESF